MTDFTDLRAALERDRAKTLEFLASHVNETSFASGIEVEHLARVQMAIQAIKEVESEREFAEFVSKA